MNCEQVREHLLKLAGKDEAAPVPAVEEHLHECRQCAQRLADLRQTMKLLDEWVAPEPSPYFDVRLRARLREEAERPAPWWAWARKPALAATMAVLLVAGISLFRGGRRPVPVGQPGQVAQVVKVQAEPGTAVGDLQALDKDGDLYADFDMLDDLAVKQAHR
jgi:predicted anti-sigma-YlaC factor YlaD